MPRQARLDAPGVLHHIMIPGIERRKIFINDRDRENFLARLAKILPVTQTARYSWVFVPNHAHFLFRTGVTPLATVMRRLLTGYAVSFNRRHKRHGQLFQNRYKSIVCREDAYLKELVRYIHLNPVRAGTIKSLKELNNVGMHFNPVGTTCSTSMKISDRNNVSHCCNNGNRRCITKTT